MTGLLLFALGFLLGVLTLALFVGVSAEEAERLGEPR